jgi:hypothetical protein
MPTSAVPHTNAAQSRTVPTACREGLTAGSSGSRG